jgi:hypothetical protein
MPLPSSGQMSVADIAANQGANSVGVVTPYSMFQLSILAGKNFVWDGIPVYYDMAVSSFYSYAGYGYKYGSPAILHDFGLSSRFPTNSSSIIDTSGNGRTGTFVTGTGNGSAVNVTGYTQSYVARLATAHNGQYSVRLDDTAKYGGTASFTWLAWFRNTSFDTSYNGIIACEGRSGNAIGQSLYISNASGTFIQYERWNGTSGSAAATNLTFGSGGVPAYVSGKWYMVALRYNGSTAVLELYVNGTRYSSSVNTTNSVTTSASWGCFAGLRYNQWMTGQLGYVACYSSDIGTTGTGTINDVTRFRYDF